MSGPPPLPTALPSWRPPWWSYVELLWLIPFLLLFLVLLKWHHRHDQVGEWGPLD